MARAMKYGMILLAGWWLPACARLVPPPPDPAVPGPLTRQVVRERVSMVVVAARQDIAEWSRERRPQLSEKEEMDGGSAAPITPDGYFLTADHVLARVSDGWHAFVVYGRGEQPQVAKARVVWRSASADLALLHAPLATPRFYRWTPPQRWLPAGARIVHGGIASGSQSAPGKLATPLGPEGWLTGARRFKLDMELSPGDSGGPVVDAYGRLIGINSAVEFLVPIDTRFFVDSEGCRPNIRKLGEWIQRDRARNIPR
jgi:S1-C subfamily serine protease